MDSNLVGSMLGNNTMGDTVKHNTIGDTVKYNRVVEDGTMRDRKTKSSTAGDNW